MGLGRKRLVLAMRNSLKRLQLDYVDMLFLHRPDIETPLEETVRAVAHLIEQGRADYWGTSEFSAQQVMQIYTICDKHGFPYPIAEQCEYNMFNRQKLEVEYRELLQRYGLGTTIWSPLLGGILTGKYNQGIPEGSRAHNTGTPEGIRNTMGSRFEPDKLQGTLAALQGLGTIASELGCSQAQLALAWCLKNSDVSTAIMGGTQVSQVQENLGALSVLEKYTAEVDKRIEELIKSRPDPGINWRNWAPLAGRRVIR